MKNCDLTKIEELEMTTDLLNQARLGDDLYDCIRPAKKKERNEKKESVRMKFQPTQQQISSLVLAALSIRSTIDESQSYSKKNSAAQKCFVCVAEHNAVTILNQTNSSSAAKA